VVKVLQARDHTTPLPQLCLALSQSVAKEVAESSVCWLSLVMAWERVQARCSLSAEHETGPQALEYSRAKMALMERSENKAE
jgi:hypothetical protein